jgi:PEP-CTERM motif
MPGRPPQKIQSEATVESEPENYPMKTPKTPTNLKSFVCLSVSAALLLCCSVSRADITGFNLAADGDGVMTCSTYGFETNAPGDYQLTVYGDHNSFEAGHILGNILTDGTDPSLTLNHTIDNDTGFIWTDYHLKITLDKTFTLTGVNVANIGWYSVVTAPTADGFGNYVGYIDYYSGNPVPIGQLLTFGYTMTFTGTVAFSEELMPTTSVPEPASVTFLLLGMGALVGTWRLKQGKQV